VKKRIVTAQKVIEFFKEQEEELTQEIVDEPLGFCVS